MLWRGGRRSDNVEDQRGAGGYGGGGFGGSYGSGGFSGGGIRIGGGLGLVAVIVICLLFGIDPSALLQGIDTGDTGGAYQQPYQPQDQQTQQQAELDGRQGSGDPSSGEMKDFVSVVLGSTEDVWHGIFQQLGRQYREPKLVLFSNVIRSGCGVAQSASGPFYCPADSKVYIDLAFYDELRRRFHAPGDFAEAYVIAHEVGHHVQHLLGLMKDDDLARNQMSETQANAASVRLELQADCLAGIWANHANREQHIIEDGDIEEGLTAAAAIGDDRLQKQAQGYAVPDSFTHGTSKQRVHWFRTGFQSGDINTCDTSGDLD